MLERRRRSTTGDAGRGHLRPVRGVRRRRRAARHGAAAGAARVRRAAAAAGRAPAHVLVLPSGGLDALAYATLAARPRALDRRLADVRGHRPRAVHVPRSGPDAVSVQAPRTRPRRASGCSRRRGRRRRSSSSSRFWARSTPIRTRRRPGLATRLAAAARARLLFNAARVERGAEPFLAVRRRVHARSGGRGREALDAERRAVAAALGLDPPRLAEALHAAGSESARRPLDHRARQPRAHARPGRRGARGAQAGRRPGTAVRPWVALGERLGRAGAGWPGHWRLSRQRRWARCDRMATGRWATSGVAGMDSLLCSCSSAGERTSERDAGLTSVTTVNDAGTRVERPRDRRRAQRPARGGRRTSATRPTPSASAGSASCGAAAWGCSSAPRPWT